MPSFFGKAEIIKKLDDLKDHNARELAEKNLVNITELPHLYDELKKIGAVGMSIIEIDESSLKGLTEPPSLYRQLIAAAILNYELSRRGEFVVETSEKTSKSFLGLLKRDRRLAARFGRGNYLPEELQQLAESYVRNAENVYMAYAHANGR